MSESPRLDDAAVRGRLGGIRGGLPLEDEQLDVVVRLLEANGRPIRRFADLGCGDGVLSSFVRSAFPDAHAVLVDHSPEMIEAARLRFGGDADVDLVSSDLATPTWRQAVAGFAPFDAILSAFVLHYLRPASAERLLVDLHGLLAPGGIVVLLDSTASGSDLMTRAHDEAAIDSLASYRDHSGDGGRSAAVGEYRASVGAEPAPGWSAEAMVRALAAAGFESVDCYFRHFRTAIVAGRRASQG